MKYSQAYSVKSNARRAAKVAGVGPEKVTACSGGFHFPLPEVEPATWSGNYGKVKINADAQAKRSGLDASAFAIVVSFKNGQPEYGIVPAGANCKYERATGKEKAQPQEKPAKAAKADKPAKAANRSKPGEGESKRQAVLDLILRKQGATMPEITKETGWLPHTARARISGIVADEDLTIERTRLLGVTTYKATRKAKAA